MQSLILAIAQLCQVNSGVTAYSAVELIQTRQQTCQQELAKCLLNSKSFKKVKTDAEREYELLFCVLQRYDESN